MKQEWSPEEREALYLKAAACFEKRHDTVMVVRCNDPCGRHAKVMDEDKPACRNFTFSVTSVLPSIINGGRSFSVWTLDEARSIPSLQSRSSVHEELMASAFLTVPLPEAPFCVARMCMPGCWASRRRSRISISMALPMPSSLRQDCVPAGR